VCVRLEAELASLDRPPRGDHARFDDAVNRQRSELNRAAAQARRAGCNGGFLFFRPAREPGCDALMAAIARMEANLARLESRRGLHAPDPRDTASRRGRILAELAGNSCGPQYARYAYRPPVTAGGGGGRGLRDYDPNYRDYAPGTYRT